MVNPKQLLNMFRRVYRNCPTIVVLVTIVFLSPLICASASNGLTIDQILERDKVRKHIEQNPASGGYPVVDESGFEMHSGRIRWMIREHLQRNVFTAVQLNSGLNSKRKTVRHGAAHAARLTIGKTFGYWSDHKPTTERNIEAIRLILKHYEEYLTKERSQKELPIPAE